MKNNIKVDFMSNTIIVTKAFYEEACKFGTEENRQLSEVLAAYPNMKVAPRTTNQKRRRPSETKGLTYEYMTAFITILDKDNLVRFEETKQYYKKLGYSSTQVYRSVAEWFLTTYPDHKDMVVEAEPKAIRKEVKLSLAESA